MNLYEDSQNLGFFFIQNFIYTDDTDKKIESFSNIPDGWNTGQEIRPSSNVIQYALNINALIKLKGFNYKKTAFPGDYNSIILGWIRNDIYINILVTDKGIEDLTLEKGLGYSFDVEMVSENPTLEMLIKLLSNYSTHNECCYNNMQFEERGKCDSSEFLITTNTTMTWGGSKVDALQIYAMG